MPPDPRPDWVRDRRREIGHRIARWRASRDWSSYELAAAADVSRLSIHRAEHGTHSTGLDVLLQLAAALGVTVGQLLDEEPPQPPSRG